MIRVKVRRSRLLDGEITELKALLGAARRGDRSALDKLFSLLYRELHQLAHARLPRDRRSPLLDTTSLVHESYLRCLKAQALDVVDRSSIGTRLHLSVSPWRSICRQ